MAKLVFKIQDGKDMEYLLTTAETTLGRREDNEIVINNTWISGRHAMFSLGKDGLYEVKDLGSSNGTFVNGVRVESQKLRDGDAVSFGQLDTLFVDEGHPKLPVAVAPKPAVPEPSPVLKITPSTMSNGSAQQQAEPNELGQSPSVKSPTGGDQATRVVPSPGSQSGVATLEPPKRSAVAATLERPAPAADASNLSKVPAAEIAQAAEQLKVMQAQLVELRQQAEQEQKTDEARRTQVETDLKAKAQELTAMESAAREMEQAASARREEKISFEELSSQARAARQELLEMTQQTAALRAEAAVLGAKNFQLIQTQITQDKLQQSIADAQAAHQHEIAAHEALMASNKQALAEVRQSLAELQERTQAEEVRHLEASQHSASQMETLQSLHEQSERLATVRQELEETQRSAEVEQKRQGELIAKAGEELRSIKAEVAEAQVVKSSLLEAKSELADVRQALENEGNLLAKARATAASEISEWEARIVSLQQLHAKHQSEQELTLAILQAERRSLEPAVKALQAEHRELEKATQQMAMMKEQLAHLEQEKQAHTVEIAALSASRAEQEEALVAATARHAESQEKWSALQKLLGEGSVESKRLSADLQKSVQALEDTGRRYEKIQKETEQAMVALAGYHQELASVGGKLQELAETETQLQRVQADLQSTQAALQKEQQTAADLGRSRLEKEKSIFDLNTEIDRLSSLQKEMQAVEPKLAAASAEFALFEKYLQDSREASAKLREEQKSLQQGNATEASKLAQLQNQAADLEKQVAAAQRQSQEVEVALRAKSMEADQAHATFENHQKELQCSLQAGEIKLQTQRGELLALSGQRDALQKEVADSTHELQTRAASLDQHQREISAARATLAEQHAALKASQLELQNAGKALEALKAEQRTATQTAENFQKQHVTLDQELHAKREKLALEKKVFEQRQRESMELEVKLQQQTAAQQQIAAKSAEEIKSLATMHGQRAKLESELSELQAGIAKRQAQSQEATTAAEMAATCLAEVTDALKSSKKEMASLQQSKATLSAEVKAMESTRRKLDVEMQAQQSKRQEFEDLARRAMEYQTLLAQGPPPLTPGKVARLEEQIKVLEDRRNTIAAAIDTNWGTVHDMGKNLIKQLDFQDDLIAQLENNQSSPEALGQVKVLRAGILDMLREFGITAYGYAPETEVDMAMRKRIQIVESRTSDHAKTKILATFRPGYVCTSAPDHPPTLLRKAEVSVSTPT